jgi:hypothetical protein
LVGTEELGGRKKGMLMIDCLPRLWIAAAVAACSLVGVGSIHAAEPESLQYRHVAGATLHYKDETILRGVVQNLRALGCEFTVKGHFGHYDLAYRCPEWRQITGSHEELGRWASFLASLTFETSHRHERTIAP